MTDSKISRKKTGEYPAALPTDHEPLPSPLGTLRQFPQDPETEARRVEMVDRLLQLPQPQGGFTEFEQIVLLDYGDWLSAVNRSSLAWFSRYAFTYLNWLIHTHLQDVAHSPLTRQLATKTRMEQVQDALQHIFMEYGELDLRMDFAIDWRVEKVVSCIERLRSSPTRDYDHTMNSISYFLTVTSINDLSRQITTLETTRRASEVIDSSQEELDEPSKEGSSGDFLISRIEPHTTAAENEPISDAQIAPTVSFESVKVSDAEKSNTSHDNNSTQEKGDQAHSTTLGASAENVSIITSTQHEVSQEKEPQTQIKATSPPPDPVQNPQEQTQDDFQTQNTYKPRAPREPLKPYHPFMIKGRLQSVLSSTPTTDPSTAAKKSAREVMLAESEKEQEEKRQAAFKAKAEAELKKKQAEKAKNATESVAMQGPTPKTPGPPLPSTQRLPATQRSPTTQKSPERSTHLEIAATQSPQVNSSGNISEHSEVQSSPIKEQSTVGYLLDFMAKLKSDELRSELSEFITRLRGEEEEQEGEDRHIDDVIKEASELVTVLKTNLDTFKSIEQNKDSILSLEALLRAHPDILTNPPKELSNDEAISRLLSQIDSIMASVQKFSNDYNSKLEFFKNDTEIAIAQLVQKSDELSGKDNELEEKHTIMDERIGLTETGLMKLGEWCKKTIDAKFAGQKETLQLLHDHVKEVGEIALNIKKDYKKDYNKDKQVLIRKVNEALKSAHRVQMEHDRYVEQTDYDGMKKKLEKVSEMVDTEFYERKTAVDVLKEENNELKKSMRDLMEKMEQRDRQWQERFTRLEQAQRTLSIRSTISDGSHHGNGSPQPLAESTQAPLSTPSSRGEELRVLSPPRRTNMASGTVTAESSQARPAQSSERTLATKNYKNVLDATMLATNLLRRDASGLHTPKPVTKRSGSPLFDHYNIDPKKLKLMKK